MIFAVRHSIEFNLDDVIFGNAIGQEVIFKQRIEQIRFAASPNAGNDLDKPVAFALNEPVQVYVSFDFFHDRPTE